MPLPEFTPAEAHLVHYIKAKARVGPNLFMWAYIAFGLLTCGFSIYHESPFMLVCAFVVICGFRVYEDWDQSKYLPIYKSIIAKYESSIVESDNRNAPFAESETQP